MRPEEEDGYTQVSEDANGGGAGVIGGPVQADHAVILPAWALPVQPSHEVMEVDLHRLIVGVGLGDA